MVKQWIISLYGKHTPEQLMNQNQSELQVILIFNDTHIELKNIGIFKNTAVTRPWMFLNQMRTL